MLKPLALLVLPIVLILPIGVAQASDLDVQTDSARVTIASDGGMRIESTDSGTIIIPSHRTAIPNLSGLSRQTVSPSRPIFDRYRPWWNNQSLTLSQPQITQTHCSGSGYSQQISQSSSSGTGVSRSYSSTSTNTCH
jgi:hypothetical protein